jgi:RNA polymerase sigma-70 factor (ECF subfamily)
VEKATPLHAVARVDEQELVARCLEGERAAQRQLFEREKRRVQATLYRILGSNQHLEDLLQEVFLSVFRFLPKFRHESSLSTWVDACAVRTALSYLRSSRSARAQRHLELVPESIASDDPSAERRALAREATRRLYATLERLPAKHRTAFALYAIDDRTMSEVAELMGATVIATKARVWRARLHLEKRARVDPVLAEYLTQATGVPIPAPGERPPRGEAATEGRGGGR